MTSFLGLDDPELAHDETLAALVAEVRTAFTTGPDPEVRPQLMAVLTRGRAGCPDLAPAPARMAPTVGRRRGLVERLQGRGPRLALGAAVAGLSFLGAGSAGALPGPAQSAFERTAAAVGVDLPEARDGNDSLDPAEQPPTIVPGAEPGDDQRTGERPGDEPAVIPDPAPSTGQLPGEGDRGDEPPEGTGGPGNDLSRDARELGPSQGRGQPGPPPDPGAGNGGPPEGVPAPAVGGSDRPGPPDTPAPQLGARNATPPFLRQPVPDSATH